MDEISYEFEIWPDRIIDLRITSPWLLKKSDCLTLSSAFSFDWIFLKLADKIGMDEFSDELET